jgi:carboxymethylenebutenolidase
MSQPQPEGYLAVPPVGSGSPVLVLHAWWGLNDTIKAFCNRLADAGFVVFAPDLYHGKVVKEIPEAQALVTALDANADQAQVEAANAVKFLKERAGAGDSTVAVIAFSMGAYYALNLAANDPETIRSVVLFYGVGPADFGKSKADYLGHFADHDEYEPPENVQWLEKSLREAGRPMTFYTYPNTHHWFFEPDRVNEYNPEAAALAWERTLVFLRRA